MSPLQFVQYLRNFRRTKLTLGNGLNGAMLKFQDSTLKDIDTQMAFLINNHLISIESLIEQISYHLMLANTNNSTLLTRALTQAEKEESIDTNLIEFNKEKSLNAAIVFNNSLFDYIKILIILIYTDKEKLQDLAKKDDVEEKMKENNIHTSDWYLAMFSIIEKKFFNEWKDFDSNIVSENIISNFSVLKDKQKQFKDTYQANSLKHFGTTAFYRTDPSNLTRSDFCNIDICTFYCNDKAWEMPIGSRGHTLDFEKTKKGVTENFKDKVEFIRLLVNQIK